MYPEILSCCCCFPAQVRKTMRAFQSLKTYWSGRKAMQLWSTEKINMFRFKLYFQRWCDHK